MDFKLNDHVCASGWCEGVITHIDDDVAYVMYTTERGGGCMAFRFSELELIPERKATLKAFKSVHGTVHVVIQNCSPEVAALLHRFDVWKSNGNNKYDENKPWQGAEIWFECPMEFLDFVESSMGRAAFQRMGVEEFNINNGKG